ncbi:hypothetical protein IH779_00145 [Patescibacteria group bacterium]|nr:hypothetical protein [Patescibacteria group bacterium]
MVRWLNRFPAYEEKEITKKHKKVHPQRKGQDSPGGFGFERTREVD